jgi:hypothetical protein
MPTTLTAREIARRELPDWRYLLGRLEATFRCGTFGAAGRLGAAIADAADAAGTTQTSTSGTRTWPMSR